MEERVYLREWRLAKGLTQPELARRVGTVKSEISRLERGSRRMTLNWMKAVSEAFGISVEELMTVPPIGFGAVSPAPQSKADRSDVAWVDAKLGEITVGVKGSSLSLVTIRGDDWQNTFATGDIVVVDKTKKSTLAPGLFAVSAGEEIIVRRIASIDGKLRLTCDNPAYEVTTDEARISVVGRLVGHVKRI